jgi:hypothetical protein
MKLLDLKWPSWITKMWTPPAPPPSLQSNVAEYRERIDRLFPEHPKNKRDEETVILLGDHSHDLDPPA